MAAVQNPEGTGRLGHLGKPQGRKVMWSTHSLLQGVHILICDGCGCNSDLLGTCCAGGEGSELFAPRPGHLVSERRRGLSPGPNFVDFSQSLGMHAPFSVARRSS